MGTPMSAIRSEIDAAIADAATHAANPKMKFGDASTRWAADRMWQSFAEVTADVDDDTYSELLDRLFGEVLGVLAGHATNAHALIGNPLTHVSVGAEVDGARMLLATLADLYAAHERPLPATAFARVHAAAEQRRTALANIVDGDFAEHQQAQRP